MPEEATGLVPELDQPFEYFDIEVGEYPQEFAAFASTRRRS